MPESSSESAMNVIVIDDSLSVIKYIESIVTKNKSALAKSIKIHSFFTAEDALATITAGLQAALILLDINLPLMSGLQALPLIRERFPDIPIVIITADLSAECTLKALDLGASGWLLKPFSPPQLFQSIDTYLNQRRTCLA